MPAVNDPRVSWAIRRSYERQARRRIRKDVAAALERAGAASIRELVELTGLDRVDCCRAVDLLRIAGRVVEDPPGVFSWVESDSPSA